MCQNVFKSGLLNLLEPSGPIQACNGIALPLPWYYTTQLGNLEGVLSKLGYGLDNRHIVVRFPSGAQQRSLPKRPYRSWGPSSLLINGYPWTFPGKGVKLWQRQTDYSTPYRSQVKNRRSCTSAPPHAFMARTGKTLSFKWLNPFV